VTAPPPPDVLILGGRPEGWHGARLREALERVGLTAARVDFRDTGFDLGEGVRLTGVAGLPRVALVRSIPAGGFEEVTVRLGLLHALEALGVAVVNHARAVERCVDKAMTSFLLARRGLPTPPTRVVQSREAAARWCALETAAGHLTVLKPLFGAQGRGLRLLRGPEDLPATEEVGGVFYLQRFVGEEAGGWRDFRVFVVGQRAVAAMARCGATWVTNIGQGGRPEPLRADGRLADLAVAAASAVEVEHAGVDLIADRGGALQLLEVNSMPAWQGLQGVSGADIALELARHLAGRTGRSPGAAR
jgi:tetrahydromethanopterin:alpha-L-glutamate ligase